MSDPVLDIPFSGGIDESVREELVDAARAFAVLNNGRQDQKGGYTKRPAYAALTTNTLDSTVDDDDEGLYCFDHKSAPCMVTAARKLWAFSPELSCWMDRGRLPEAHVELIDAPNISVASGGTSASVVDIAAAGNYVVTAYTASPGSGGNAIYAAVQDLTGAVISAPTFLAQGTVSETTVALASYADQYVIAFVVDSNSANVLTYYIDLGTRLGISNGWLSGPTVATDKNTSGAASLAVSSESLTNRVAFVYVNNSGGASRVTVKTLTTSAVLETATVNTSSVTPAVVAVEGSIADTLWVAWNETTVVKIKGLDADSLASTLATTGSLLSTTTAAVSIGIVSLTETLPGAAVVMANDGNLERFSARTLITSGGAATAAAAQVSWRNVQMMSRPFTYDERIYAYFAPDHIEQGANAQRMMILGEFTAGAPAIRPVANVEPRLATAPPQGRCHWVSPSTGAYVSAIGVTSSAVVAAARLTRLDFTPTRTRPITFNGSTYIEGGALFQFDGTRAAEAGFLYSPNQPVLDTSGGTSLTFATGVKYVAVYEETEGDGNWCISAVSVPSASTGAITTQDVAVSVRPYTLTSRLATGVNDVRVRIALYRTTDGGEPPYYRVGSVAMDPFNATTTFTDTVSDTTLTSRQLLYGNGNLPETNGSSLHKHAPPGLRHLNAYNGMLVGACGRNLWFTAQTVDGESAWFHDDLTQPVDDDVTALDSADGTLYPFTRTAIYAAAGEPANDNFTTGGIGVPRRLGAPIGASGAETCSTSAGIFFPSTRGTELLQRGGQSVDLIGQRVQETEAAYPITSSIVLDQASSIVRITRAASEASGLVSGNGRDLIYDLTLGTWVSIDIKLDSNGIPAQHAAVLYVDGAWRYCWLRTNASLYYERLSSDASAHLDASAWVTLRATTGWVKIAGLQGEQFIDRLLTLMKRHTDHDVRIRLGFDYSDTWGDWKLFDSDTIASLGRQWLDREITQTTSTAVRVQIEDATPSGDADTVGTGKGSTWVALTFAGQPHRAPKRTSATQRGGS